MQTEAYLPDGQVVKRSPMAAEGAWSEPNPYHDGEPLADVLRPGFRKRARTAAKREGDHAA